MSENGGREVVVVGAGAAGLTASIFAAEAGARVTLFESTRDGGRKILISGGGRCNVLPSSLSATQYVTASSSNTLRKLLLSWPLHEQRTFFEEGLGIRLALEEETGKLFPVSNRARDVRDGLVNRARELGVDIRFGAPVGRLKASGLEGWSIWTASKEYEARRVILATGGLSVPQTGSDGRGLEMLRELGHTVNPLYAALTPLTCDPPRYGDLAGISLTVELRAPPPGGPFLARGGFLFTHRGYSGPSVLDMSHLAVRSAGPAEQAIKVRWGGLGAAEWERILTDPPGGTVLPRLRRYLPARLAERLMGEAEVDVDRQSSQLRRGERIRLLTALADYTLPWSGHEGYRKAEVTGGGVALSEVHPATLESRVAPGLFLCGELLDAFGPIGGYNFAWAWATGRLAGLGAARAVTVESTHG